MNTKVGCHVHRQLLRSAISLVVMHGLQRVHLMVIYHKFRLISLGDTWVDFMAVVHAVLSVV